MAAVSFAAPVPFSEDDRVYYKGKHHEKPGNKAGRLLFGEEIGDVVHFPSVIRVGGTE